MKWEVKEQSQMMTGWNSLRNSDKRKRYVHNYHLTVIEVFFLIDFFLYGIKQRLNELWWRSESVK